MKKAKRIFPLCMCIILFSAMLTDTKTTLEYAAKGLNIAITQVVPALFPFSVLSCLTVSLLNLLAPDTNSKIFKIMPVIIGFLCGFPLGAKTALDLANKGRIQHSELTYLLPLSNNTGPAFTVGALGIAMFYSYRAGLLIYICQIISALATALIMSVLIKKEKSHKKTGALPSHTDSFLIAFPKAIADSCSAMLVICGFITFFCILLGIITHVLELFAIPSHVRMMLAIMFEMSCGASDAALLFVSAPRPALALAAFAVGWAGVSVHLQVAAFLPSNYSGMPFYISFKALQGTLCAILAYFIAPFFVPI